MKRLELLGLEDIGEVAVGDAVGTLISQVCLRAELNLGADDVVVVAQKIVSKAEGRMVRLADIQPSQRAREIGLELDKDPALTEVILNESRAVIRKGGRALIVETKHGFICANAGVDCSN